MTQRIFQHDCTNCIFLGRINYRDAYYCTSVDSIGNTRYLLRYGNEGSEYISRADFENGQYLRIMEAYGFSPPRISNGNMMHFRRMALIQILSSEIARIMEI